MKLHLVPTSAWLVLGVTAAAQVSGGEGARDAGALCAALALRPEEREEHLALALAVAVTGDCERALGLLARGSSAQDELGQRIAAERVRLEGWIELRDAFLAELEAGRKPLAISVGGKKLDAAFRREGDELVLERGAPARLFVRALAPEELLPLVPKDRFTGPSEWLKIYPYCLSGNPKWKRLTTSGAEAAGLKRDAESFYPRLQRLAPSLVILERLVAAGAPRDAPEARTALASVAELLRTGRELACVEARFETLSELATLLLSRISESLELGELVHATVSSPTPDTPLLTYDFSSPEQGQDWLRDDGYLARLREPLAPVQTASEEARFAVGPEGFGGNGEFCWRHQLEFSAPLRVRYRVCWEPHAGQANRVFAFGVGALADAEERHARCMELGFLYVDERGDLYTAERPRGDATVELGRTYAIELVLDGKTAEVWIDGVQRTRADAPQRQTGRVFLWGHSDVRIRVPRIEIEGQPTAASLSLLRTAWVRTERAALGLDR